MPLRESAGKPEFPRRSPRFLLQSTPPELQFSSGDPLPKNGEAKGNPDFPLGFIPRVSPKSFRRSPRFLPRIARPEPQDPKGNPKPIYKNSEGKGDPGFSPGFSPNVSRKKMREVSREKVSRNSGNSNDGLGNSANSGTGLRKCARLSRGAAEIQCLRRSPRFLDRQKIEEERMKKIINKNDRNSKKCGVTRRVPNEYVVPQMVLRSSSRLSGGSRNCPKSSTELRKSPRVIDAGIHSLRRSLRFSNVRKTNECVKATDRVENNNCFTKPVSYRKSVDQEKASKILHKLNDGSRKCATSCDGLRKSSARNVASRIKSLGNSARSTDMGKNGEGLEKIRNSASFCKEFPLGIGGSLRSRVDSIGVERKDGKATNVDEGKKRINGIGTKRKRQDAREKRALARGWTQEQELALQNAYIAAKPTPHFWKKVAKLVPGKSAQDCFNKIHADHVTPTQRPPRSRAKKSEASTLSAGKLLKSTGLRKKVRYDKRKSHITQKSIRRLLQKQSQIDQDCELDLFSVLEPAVNLSPCAVKENVMLSTPQGLLRKVGLYEKYSEKSSSAHKKQLSRFSSSAGKPFISPPVLKPIKDRALHEKYIAQLHCREAKRRATSSRAEKSALTKDDSKSIGIQNTDVVRAAKSALVSDAQDALAQFRSKQANATCNFSDMDDDGAERNDEDEGEL